MVNRLQALYDQYMAEKEKDLACDNYHHQKMMCSLAVEMAAVEYLMKSDIDKHIQVKSKHTKEHV